MIPTVIIYDLNIHMGDPFNTLDFQFLDSLSFSDPVLLFSATAHFLVIW